MSNFVHWQCIYLIWENVLSYSQMFFLFNNLDLNDNFDLLFTKKSDSDLVYLPEEEIFFGMPLFTIVTWMKSLKGFTSGTLLSYYAQKLENERIELQIVSKNLKIVFNGRSILTNVLVADEKWHCIGISWSSPLGALNVYVDGVARQRYKGVLTNHIVSKGGAVVLGQRHPSSTNGTYYKNDSFQGYLHQVSSYFTYHFYIFFCSIRKISNL